MPDQAYVLIGFLFFCFAISAFLMPKPPRNKRRMIVLPFLLSTALNAQDSQVLRFDYWIEQKDEDKQYLLESTIEVTDSFIQVRTPYEFYSRYIVARGISRRTGEDVLFFRNCEKMRITRNWKGEVDGVFLHAKNRVTFFGVDPTAKERSGWTNEGKF